MFSFSKLTKWKIKCQQNDYIVEQSAIMLAGIFHCMTGGMLAKKLLIHACSPMDDGQKINTDQCI